MKKTLLSLFAFLAFAINADASVWTADLSSIYADGDKSQYDNESHVLSWTGSWSNSARIANLTGEEFAFYDGLTVDATIAEGTEGYRLLIYKKGDTKASEINITGSGKITKSYKDWGIPSDYINNFDCIKVSGKGGSGSITIKEFSLSIVPLVIGQEGGSLVKEDFYEWTGVDNTAERKGAGFCFFDINNSTGCAYGNPNVTSTHYADLTKYSQLIVTTTEGEPRFIFNREINDGGYLEYPGDKESKPYETVIDNEGNSRSFIIDLKAITAEYGYAHLNCIKGAYYQNVTVTSMELIAGKAVDGYCHFSSNKALDFSTVTDIEAYIVPEYADGKVYMKKVTGVVPANTGLILKDVTGASSVKIPGVEPFDSTLVNLLVPVADATEINKAEKGNNYLFDGEKWVAVTSSTKLAAGSSYLFTNSSYSLLEASYKPLSAKDPGFMEGDSPNYNPENGLDPSEKFPTGSIESPTRPENGLVTFPEDNSENQDAVGAVTGIDNAQAGKSIVRINSVGGALLNKLQKGVNIVTYSDGSRATVIIK